MSRIQQMLNDALLNDLTTTPLPQGTISPALVMALATEVRRLRKLAPWHDSERIEITGPGDHHGCHGVLVYETDDAEVGVLLEGHIDHLVFKYSDIKFITQEPTNAD